MFCSHPLKIRLRNLSSSSGSFSVNIFSISSMVGVHEISFKDSNALRTTFFITVAASFNLYSDVVRFDTATADWYIWNKDLPQWEAAFPYHLWKRDQLPNTFIFFISESVGWNSFLSQGRGYKAHKEHSRSSHSGYYFFLYKGFCRFICIAYALA